MYKILQLVLKVSSGNRRGTDRRTDGHSTAEFFGGHHIIHIKSKTWTSVTILKGYPFYVHISLVGSWPLIIAHNKLSALDDLT